MRAVVSGRLKYIEGLTTGKTEIYDQIADPEELRNIALDCPAKQGDLRRAVEKWVDTFPAFIADFGEASHDKHGRAEALEHMKALGYLGD